MLLYPAYTTILGSRTKRRQFKKQLQDIRNGLRTVENVRKAVDPAQRAMDVMTAMTVSQARRRLKKGQHIYCNRSVYSHHGIYDGNGGVYEYGGTNGDFNGEVALVSLAKFADGDGINVRNYRADFKPDTIIERAESRLGESDYNVIFNNCEHFAYWCRVEDESITSLLDLDEDREGLFYRKNPLINSIPDLGGIAGPLPGLGGGILGTTLGLTRLTHRNDYDEDDDDDDRPMGGLLGMFKRPF